MCGTSLFLLKQRIPSVKMMQNIMRHFALKFCTEFCTVDIDLCFLISIKYQIMSRHRRFRNENQCFRKPTRSPRYNENV